MSIDTPNQWPSRSQMMRDLESGDWADDHGLFHELLPYGYREDSPLDIIRSFRMTFDALGDLKQSYRLENVKEHGIVGPTPNQHFQSLHWAGSWAWTGWDSTSALRYCNPTYVHKTYPGITDFERRRWIVERTYDIPFWTNTRLAQAFGVSVRSTQRFLRNHTDVEPYEKNKRRDLPKFARTIKTIYDWGYQMDELAECFPYTRSGLWSCVENYAQDYTPPSNPYK